MKVSMFAHQKLTFFAATIAVAALQACSSLPPGNAALDDAARDFSLAQNDPVILALAPAELRQAELSLAQARDLWSRNGPTSQVDHLSYLAKRNVAIAAETARQKTAEAEVDNADKVRNRALLRARTNEADTAMRDAELAKQQTQSATRETDAAQQRAQAAELQAAQLRAQMTELNAQSTARGYVITLGGILFDTNRSELTSGASGQVRKLSNFLMKYPQRKVVVEGYTDDIGSADFNLDLSTRRAEAVRTALIATGIQDSRISVRGYGETYPVSSNTSAQNRQLNRRVEIVLSDENGTIISR
jgi:outer membrane protein OmpA-like peptidoglycan-associated protein